MQMECLTTTFKDVDTDALAARCGVSGFTVKGTTLTLEDGIGAQIVVHFDGDEDDCDRVVICYADGDSVAMEDTDGGDLTVAEEEFFEILTAIIIGQRDNVEY